MLHLRPVTKSIASSRRRKPTFDDECVTLFADVVALFGIPRSVGQIYGILYASPHPLSFSDVVDRLEISKGSASQGIALLKTLGAIVEVEHGPRLWGADGGLSSGGRVGTGSTRTVYEPVLSLRKLLKGVLKERIKPFAAEGSIRLNMLRKLAVDGGAYDQFRLNRTKQLDGWRRQLKSVLPLLGALLAAGNET